jgi:hypothetical protein
MFAMVGDVPNLSCQTVPLSGSLYLPAGTNLQVLCSGYNSVAQASFCNGAITGVLINSPSGTPSRPPLRSGTACRRSCNRSSHRRSAATPPPGAGVVSRLRTRYPCM